MAFFSAMVACSCERTLNSGVLAVGFVVAFMCLLAFACYMDERGNYPIWPQLKHSPVIFLGSVHSRAKWPSWPQLVEA